MPPPTFGSRDPAHHNNAAASAAISKHQASLVKDVLNRCRALLVQDGPVTSTAALSSIEILLSEPTLGVDHAANGASGNSVAESASASSNAGQNGGAAGGTSISGSSASPFISPRSAVASKINAGLLDIFSDEMDQANGTKLAHLVEVLNALSPLLDPSCIVTAWWDLVLRPLLKDPFASSTAAASARTLVIFAMSAAPSAAYREEPPPTAVWPEQAKQSRKVGDAPYPAAAATPSHGPTSSRRRQHSNPITQQMSDQSSAIRSASAAPNIPSPPTRAPAPDMFWRYAQRMFDLYLSEATLEPSAREDDDAQEDARLEAAEAVGREAASADPAVDLVGSTWRGNLEAILLEFGRDRPTHFFHHLAESFSEPLARVPLLLLLTIYLRLYSMNVYRITSTALLRQLILSLQLDTSKTIVSLGLTTLVMLLPHIPNWIASGGAGGLPVLLSVYARVVDWKKLGGGWENRLGDSEEAQNARREHDEEFTAVARIGKRLAIRSDIEWKRLESSFDTAPTSKPDASQFFTFLYGLFPCNVVRFLRAPINYLRQASYDGPFELDWEDLIDEGAVQSRSIPILRRHVLHPALITLTAESEICDKRRWLQHDAADITAECISLYLGTWYDPMPADAADGRSSTHHPSRQGTTGTSAHYVHMTSGSHRASVDSAQDVIPSGMASPPVLSLAMSQISSSGSGKRNRELQASEENGRGGVPGSPDAPFTASSFSSRHTRQNSNGNNASHLTTPRSALGSPSLRPIRTAVNADDILQTYASLRSGAALTSSGLVWAADSDAGINSISRSLSSTPTTAYHAANGRSGPAPPLVTSGNVSSALFGRPIDTPVSSPPSPYSAPSHVRSRSRSASLTSPLPLGSSRGTHPLTVSQVGRSGDSSQTTMSPSASQSPALRPSVRSVVYTELAYLQRENLLLRNELNFELYLKEQHLRHIGRLHRDRIADTALEAERQNLYQTLRSLRTQLAAATAAAEKQRAEAARATQRHVQWSDEQSAKLRTYRAERTAWSTDARALRARIEEAEATIATQSVELEAAGAEAFALQTRLRDAGPKLASIEAYERKVAQLTRCLAYWNDDVRKYGDQQREMELLLGRWEEMEMLLAAQDRECLEARDREEGLRDQIRRGEDEVRQLRERLESVLAKAEYERARVALQEQAGAGGARYASSGKRYAHLGDDDEHEESALLRTRLEKLEATLLDARARNDDLTSELAYERRRAATLAADAARVEGVQERVRQALEVGEEEIGEIDLGGQRVEGSAEGNGDEGEEHSKGSNARIGEEERKVEAKPQVIVEGKVENQNEDGEG